MGERAGARAQDTEPAWASVAEAAKVSSQAASPESNLASKTSPNGARAASPNLACQWIDEVHRLWAQGATSTLALARVVYQARRTLAYGDWTRLWAPGVIPFSKRKAEMLAATGKGIGLIDAQTFAHLPRHWSVLYYLSQLGQAVVEQLVRTGTIHPGLTLQEARALAARHKGQEPPRRRENLRQKLRQFEKFVAATLSEWTIDERRWTQCRLNSLAKKIDLGSPTSLDKDSSERPASLDLSNFAEFTLSPGNIGAHALVALQPRCFVPFDFHQAEI